VKNPPSTAGILAYLGCSPGTPGIRSLNRLVQAFIRKVPWESAFRIAKRAVTPDLAQRPRWPDEFWRDAIQSGGGGTCFENNYAFFCLLRSLGYTGYLTVNDMGEQRGCHAAIVILLDGRKYLVDVGIPLLTALPVDPGRATRRSTWLHGYTVQPDGARQDGADRYQVLRSRHPKPNIYTLFDTPVSEPDYRRVVEQDYGEAGLFLDKVIVVKVIGERLWRFSSAEQPYCLEWFGKAERGSEPIPTGQVASAVANRVLMDEVKIEEAIGILKSSMTSSPPRG